MFLSTRVSEDESHVALAITLSDKLWIIKLYTQGLEKLKVCNFSKNGRPNLLTLTIVELLR